MVFHQTPRHSRLKIGHLADGFLIIFGQIFYLDQPLGPLLQGPENRGTLRKKNSEIISVKQIINKAHYTS